MTNNPEMRHGSENEDYSYPDPSQDESLKAVHTVARDLRIILPASVFLDGKR